MVGITPFHERTNAANVTGLWSHWAGMLGAEKYQLSEKAEYFAVRNSVGVFDTSPLYKYRIEGPDGERYLSGLLARDIRTCRPDHAQYTIWCDDAGYVIEDGVILRESADSFLLTSARPNLSSLRQQIGYDRVEIVDVTEELGALAIQGPLSRAVLSKLAPEVEDLEFFETTTAKIAGGQVTISRTGFTGDLGYEVWVPASQCLEVWDAIFEAGHGYGIEPFGQIALLMARIEAGLLLIDVDFESSRYAFNEHQKSTPVELGLRWMFRGVETDDRPFRGRDAIRLQLADRSERWRMVGLVVDWQDYDRLHVEGGLIPPKDHLPYNEEMMVYDDDRTRVGYSKSFMYSPVLQRHIAIARVLPELATVGTDVNLEVTINHRYEMVKAKVARLPLYNPDRKTA